MPSMASGPRIRRANLRIRRRRALFADVLPLFRSVLIVLLIAAMTTSLYRHFTSPWQAGALEFTPHVIGSEGGATGVLGIDTADMDSDGDLDVVTVGNNGVQVYENTGGGTYVRKLIDDKQGERVQLVDFTGDGNPDVLATMNTSPSLRWYKNEGGLEFSGSYIGTGASAQAVSVDLDRDGDNDIIAASDESGTYTIRAWKNDGEGVFTSTAIPASGNPSVTALGAGDFDGEGYSDVIISGSGGVLAFDTADGNTWTEYTVDTGNTNHTHLTVADVNGDERPDITLARQDGDAVEYYEYKGVNQFEKNTVGTDVDATTVEVVDIDGDDDKDILVAAQDDHSVYWYDNNGEESFTQRTVATDVTTVFGIASADIDGDDDIDVVTGDHVNGTIWWYEQTLSKPTASAPTNIRQTVDGAGRITFDTTITDVDFRPTRIRIQYSLDGQTWHKPWLLRVTPQEGAVDLKNSNGYQVGTANAIDTDDYGSVKLTLLWDTKSSQNTGGPLVGDVSNVRLRVIPYNGTKVGDAVQSAQFRVDNSAPQGLANLRVVAADDSAVGLRWDKPTDSSAFTYKLYYGTDHAAVLEQRSAVWDGSDHASMNDSDTTAATVTGLSKGTTYTFKLFATDAFGNTTAAPSTKGTASAPVATPAPTPTTSTAPGTTTTPIPGTSVTPTPIPGTSVTPTPSSVGSPTPTPSGGVFAPTPTPTFDPDATPAPSQDATPTPIPTFSFETPTPPPTTFENQPPVADAGIDQAVNPSALVILDGSASADPDGDALSYVWRQLSGPEVDVISGRTATPSFSAGEENDTYIFALTVRDRSGASAGDTVTIAVRPLPQVETVPVESGESPETVSPEEVPGGTLGRILTPIDIGLLIISLLLTGVSLVERAMRSSRKGGKVGAEQVETNKGKVVHYRTGEPISGALVLVYSSDGKLRSRERTNAKGEFSTLFPVGQYTIGVQSESFTFSPAASPAIRPEEGILYSGGKITVPAGGKPIALTVPMKPTGKQVTATKTRALLSWQSIQRWSRVISWPVFVAGSLLNTVLIFLIPSPLYLGIEVLYVALIVVKVALEVRMRPAYGLVRDAITHVPADLAVVRLFEQGTNRLVMTRVTDSQGRFFALPPTGKYTVTVTKPGYAVFSKENVDITSEQDSVLQMTAELMPVAPQSALAQAKGAVL